MPYALRPSHRPLLLRGPRGCRNRVRVGQIPTSQDSRDPSIGPLTWGNATKTSISNGRRDWVRTRVSQRVSDGAGWVRDPSGGAPGSEMAEGRPAGTGRPSLGCAPILPQVKSHGLAQSPIDIQERSRQGMPPGEPGDDLGEEDVDGRRSLASSARETVCLVEGAKHGGRLGIGELHAHRGVRGSPPMLGLRSGGYLPEPQRDGLSNIGRGLVLPESQDRPPSLAKPLIRVPVSLSVAFDLLAPEVGVRPRPGCMFRTAVPEATVDESGHACASEDDVGPSSDAGDGGEVDPVPEPAGVEKATHGHLRPRVSTTVAAHAPAHTVRRGPGMFTHVGRRSPLAWATSSS